MRSDDAPPKPPTGNRLRPFLPRSHSRAAEWGATTLPPKPPTGNRLRPFLPRSHSRAAECGSLSRNQGSPLRTSLLLLPSLLSLVLAQGVARADASSPSNDEQKAAARMLGTEGVKLALSGDCPQAVDKLTRAEALVHAPTTAVPLAQCHIQLGRLVAGTEILNRVLRENLPENAPKPWVDARKRAQTLLDATEPRIAKLRIHVERPAGPTGDVQVTIDGELVPTVLLDNDRPTDPGRHHVIASAQGFASAESDASLGDGQSQTLSLRLEPQAGAPPVVAPEPQPLATTAQPPSPAPQPASPPNRTPGYIVLGVGAAGIAVGTVFGVLALGVVPLVIARGHRRAAHGLHPVDRGLERWRRRGRHRALPGLVRPRRRHPKDDPD